MGNDQLSIFDIDITTEDEESVTMDSNIEKRNEKEDVIGILPYSIGDKVRLDWEAIKAKNDVETYYYLLGFKEKRGIVLEVIENPKLQYRVQFKEEITYLYHDEITI